MKNIIETMWLRIFIFAAGKMGFRLIFPYDKDMVVHLATSQEALLASMRDYIEDHEAETKRLKKEALES
jgi:hypothetical protein